MGTRTMKKDLFTLRALESKGYDLEQLKALTDEEVAKLPISTKLIEGIMEIRARGGKTAEQIAEDIADLMMRSDEEAPAELPEVAKAYSTDELVGVMARKLTPEEIESLEITGETKEMTDDEVAVFDEVVIAAESNDEIEGQVEVQEVDVVHAANNADDIAVIKEALQSKSAKSFQPFIKHLKAEVPKDILEAVESTVVAELIEARIAEVKAESDK